MTGPLNMGGFKIANAAGGSLSTDGATKGQLGTLSAKAANYTAVLSDYGAYLRFTATSTLSLTAAATLGPDWRLNVIADGGDVTIDPNGSETINGQQTLVIPNGTVAEIICDGANFYTALPPGTIWQAIQDVSFSAVAGVNFTNLGNYRRLRCTGSLTTSVNSALAMRTSINNGSTFENGASDYAVQNTSYTGTTVATAGGAASQINITGGLLADSGSLLVFEFLMDNFNVSGPSKLVARSTFNSSSTGAGGQNNSGRGVAGTARNAFTLFPQSGGTMTGKILLEGIRG